MKRVGIFDADAPGALAFVRSLGRQRVPLRVYSHRRWPVARFSRHCAEFARCPDTDHAEAFVPWLERELRSGRIDLVAPTSDLIAFYGAELRASFPAHDAVVDCLFKHRFDAACARLGFRTPWAKFPGSVAEAHDLAETYRYPALLKPKSHVGIGLAHRGRVVHDAAELRREYRAYEVPERYRRYPELSLPMIQECVPAALENLYSVSGVLGANGEVIAASASRKTGQWPPTLGVGIEFQAIADAELMARGTALAQGVLGSGIFEVEFIRDLRSGDLLAIDLNPRAHGFISFDIARGHDLPLLWYRLASGEAVKPAAPARDDLVWIHAIPWQVRRWVRRGRGLALPVAPANAVDIVNDLRDPLPSAVFTAVMLRHPGGLIRPFVNDTDARADTVSCDPDPAV
jgi:predicted ATP-grasp superfamily ATP-dependent carboligase